MKNKMKNRELLKMYETLNKNKEQNNFNLNYAISKNLKKMKDIVTPINSMIDKELKGEEQFTEARIILCNEHAVKDDKGKPKLNVNPITGLREYIISDMQKYEVELNKLANTPEHEEYSKLKGEHETNVEKLKNEDADKIEWHMVKKSDIPKALNVPTFIIDLIDVFILEE